MDEWDKLIFNKASEIIHHGDTVIDVGAHVGMYTKHFYKLVGKSGKVIAFELNPKTFGKLKGKFKDQSNTTLINAAVSDMSGLENYYSDCVSQCTNTIGRDVNGKKNAPLGKIKSVRLDEFIKEEITFIKIDVEGAEIKVLRGLEKAINNINYLLIECHFVEDWPEIKEILLSYDLKCTNLKTGAVITAETEERKPYQLLCHKLL